jgi:histidinol phosphatase-like enzyme
MRSGYIEGYFHEKKLVGPDDKLRQELVGQGVKVSAVKLGVGSSFEVGFCPTC